MKKILFLMAACASLAVLASCNKTCNCVTQRAQELPVRCVEKLGNHKSCAELNREWVASDTTGDLLTMTCVAGN